MIAEGAFVRALFPTHEHPRRPGLLHICYCLGVAPPIALLAYTSSQPWPAGSAVPLGVRIVDRDEAASLNQRPFVIYLNRIAKLPLSQAWFPEIGAANQGVVAVASTRLRNELMAAALALVKKRRDLIQQLGPA